MEFLSDSRDPDNSQYNVMISSIQSAPRSNANSEITGQILVFIQSLSCFIHPSINYYADTAIKNKAADKIKTQ